MHEQSGEFEYLVEHEWSRIIAIWSFKTIMIHKHTSASDNKTLQMLPFQVHQDVQGDQHRLHAVREPGSIGTTAELPMS